VQHRHYLFQRYRLILGYTGLVLVITGAIILSTLLVLPFYPEEIRHATGILIPGGLLALCGLGLWRGLRPDAAVGLTFPEGCAIVVLTWCGAVAAGAACFMLLGDLTLTQAVFEATSGWTTTGLSVVDVTAASRLLLLLRSTLQLAGGAGLVIVMLSALAGPSGTGLSAAEGRGEQLVPNVRRSTRLVVVLYAGYALAGVLGLRLSGMGWFDAVNQSFAAVSTGGFSTRPESIGYWNSPFVEAVIILLMLVGSTNFLVAYVIVRGHVKALWRSAESRVAGFIFPVAALIVLISSALPLYASLGKAVRVAIFETVSAGSTTGFSTVGYLDWPALGWLVLIVMMTIGGGTGSTAGGIKQFRIYVLYRGARWQIRSRLAPRDAITEEQIWVGDRRRFLGAGDYRDAATYSFVHVAALAIGTGILAAHGNPLPESLFEYASALATTGLSIGITSPAAPPGVLWAESAGMFLGRLEFFAFLIGVLKLARDTRGLIGKK
jgi:trk system potassium uptake protein TrkH